MITISLKDRIDTSFSGYKKLTSFYIECADYTNEIISMNLYDLEWIDGNMSALLDAILYKLEKENGLRFSTDFEFLKKKFDVLLRNGFIDIGEKIEDDRKSTVPMKSFDTGDKKGFINYVEGELMEHRGMPALTSTVKEQIIQDIIEVFCNSHYHANTTDPFFVAGQYYPRQRELRFTMVDLGDGFLPRISKATNGKIGTSLEAINWAVSGNSSKRILENTSGGLGLQNIRKYCTETGGTLDIVTGDGYWSTGYAGTIFDGGRVLGANAFAGTTLNLTFRST